MSQINICMMANLYWHMVCFAERQRLNLSQVKPLEIFGRRQLGNQGFYLSLIFKQKTDVMQNSGNLKRLYLVF